MPGHVACTAPLATDRQLLPCRRNISVAFHVVDGPASCAVRRSPDRRRVRDGDGAQPASISHRGIVELE